MVKIILFQFETCPFCAKVRTKLDKLGLEYVKVDMPYERDNSERKELFEKSGVWTVPVIKIDEKYIGDSGVIIKYLENNFLKK